MATDRDNRFFGWGLFVSGVALGLYTVIGPLAAYIGAGIGLMIALRGHFPSWFVITSRITRKEFIHDPNATKKNNPPGYLVDRQEEIHRESAGCWIAAISLAVMVGVAASKFQSQFTEPSWRLTKNQRDAVASIASEMPASMSLIVEFPPAYNRTGQSFGKEVRKTMSDNSKGKINKIDVVYSGNPQLEGLGVLVPPDPVDGSICLSARYGSALNGVLGQAGIESSLMIDHDRSRAVDCSSVIVYVGKQPKN